MSILIRILLLWLLLWLAPPSKADPVRDLVVAAQLDSPGAVRQLLAKGVSPNTVDPITGETVLMIAVREQAHAAAAELLAHKDLDTERKAPNGNTALMLAAFKHNKRAVLALLARGALVRRPGWTALHYAAASGSGEIATILLGKNAQVDAASPDRLTPLMMAAREGHRDVVELLLRAGADARLKSNGDLDASQMAELADHAEIAASIRKHLGAKR